MLHASVVESECNHRGRLPTWQGSSLIAAPLQRQGFAQAFGGSRRPRTDGLVSARWGAYQEQAVERFRGDFRRGQAHSSLVLV